MTSSTEHPCPGADLWILAGQSNMQGWGFFTETFTPHPRIWSFGMDYEWAPALPPLHHFFAALDPVHRLRNEQKHPIDLLDQLAAMGRAGTATAAGPGFFFAQSLIKRLPEDKQIALLPVAHGGTALDEWAPDPKVEPGASLYGAMMKRIAASGLTPKGMLWYQGESDTPAELAPSYLERFTGWVERLRSDLGAPDLPILTVQIARVSQWPDVEGWNRVQEAQRLAAERIEGVEMASILDGPLDDHIHISVEAHKMLGERLARLALTKVYEAGEYGRTIRLGGVEAAVNNEIPGVVARFDGVHGRLIAPGLPAGFSILSDPPLSPPIEIHRTDLNVGGPGRIFLGLHDLNGIERLGVGYGQGANPTCNITDEAGMALPGFAPVWVAPPEVKAEPGGWDRALHNILGHPYPREKTDSDGSPIDQL
jgi:hypothetical protein